MISLRPLALTALAALIFVPCAHADESEFFTPTRLQALPATQKQNWEAYLAHSSQLMTAEKAQLSAECQGAKPQKAPAAKDFKMKTDWREAWFGSVEAKQLTDVMLTFQTPSGGWSKAVDYTKGPRVPGMQWTSQSSPFHYTATFDNRATTEQLNFLNNVLAVSPRPDIQKSIERGLDYIFAAQMPNGGWPQTFPLEGGYHDAITFNDNAMTHIMELLRDIGNKDDWNWLDADRKAKASTALTLGAQCVLDAQYVRGGEKTVWCAQVNPLDLSPVAARLKEPASLSGGESVGIVRFLMGQPATPLVKASIEGALSWFENSKVNAAGEEPKWARFYDVKTNVPLFAGAQDGIIYPTFAAMAAKNHVGYDYYVTLPRDLLEKDAPKWHAGLAK